MCDVPVVGWPATETQGDEWALLASDPNAGAANRRNTRLRVSLAAVEKRSMVGSNRLPHTPTERRRRMSREPPMEWDGRRSHASASDVAALRRVVEAARAFRFHFNAPTLRAFDAALDALPAALPVTPPAEVEALRREAAKFEASWFDAVAERVAAEADVATLRAANARLREALAPLAAIAQETWDSAPDGSYLEDIGMGSAITLGMCRIARAALQEPTP
jgi:hypothetical protein